MSDNVTETVKTNKPVAPDFLFQIFFLSQDQNQSVEVVETEQIDFGEITQRLKMGESVFIKYKNPEILESRSRINKEEERDWYFTHC